MISSATNRATSAKDTGVCHQARSTGAPRDPPSTVENDAPGPIGSHQASCLLVPATRHHTPAMPTILRKGPYRFHFYSREPGEPPPIHVARDDLEAKFWLEPVSLAENFGFAEHELSKIAGLVEENGQNFLRSWNTFHG
jgi:hypothetical protein